MTLLKPFHRKTHIYSYQKLGKDDFLVFHGLDEIDRVHSYFEARVAATLHYHFTRA